MPNDITARHRARGPGRLIALRTATPRHAVAPAGFANAATVELRVLRSWRWPLGLAVIALLLLAAVTPLALRSPRTSHLAVPLPRVSVPELPARTATPSPSASRRPLQAVRQALKPSPTLSPTPSPAPVLLGPATGAELPALLGSYCRATHGPVTLAASTPDGWVCAPLGRDPVTLDMDAMCRWRYGARGWADLGSETDPRSWRCYR